MSFARSVYTMILFLGLLLTSACEQTSTTGGTAGGGIGGTGISFGQISGFGSVIINDIAFDVSGSTITADGVSVMETQLGIGDVCLVQGTIDQNTASGTATSVVCDDNLEGPVTDVSTVTDGIIMVMGQTVQVDATTPTVFGGFSALDQLVVDNIVEIHGFVDAGTGIIQATRIELKTATFTPGVTEVEVKGTMVNFNGNDLFEIGGLTIQTTAATEIDVTGGLANGRFVEVEGTLNASRDTLTATKVEDEQDNPVAGGDSGIEVEVEGLISNFNDIGDFKVSGVQVDGSNAEIEGGSAVNLANSVKVEVEGVLNDTGALVAEMIEIKPLSDVRIEANVVGAPTATSLDVGVGPTVLTIMVNDTTELQDQTDDGADALQLTNIVAGERVKIRGFRDADTNAIIASRLEREGFNDAGKDVKLRGPVDAANDPIITIAGVDVDTSGFDDNDFEDDDTIIGRTELFNRLTTDPNPAVEVIDEGPEDGVFDKIELED